MAEQKGDILLLKKTSIQVFVDEVLPDILVVTYEFGLQIFQGVLLDSTKRNLPYGVSCLNPSFSNALKNSEDDPLYSVNQRFAYTDPALQKKKTVQPSSKYKNNKMTVRLRPRQVLCSKCKGICNENSENVSSKQKSLEATTGSQQPPSPITNRRVNSGPVTRSVKNISNTKRKLRGYQEDEESEDTNKKRTKKIEEINENEIEDNWVDTDSLSLKKSLINVNNDVNNEPEVDPLLIEHSEEHSEVEIITDNKDQSVFQQPTQTQVLRAARRTKKKKCTNTAEECNETDVQLVSSDQSSSSTVATSVPSGTSTTNTRTIKISYGPQGEGTVLKIPAQIDNLPDDEENTKVTSRLPVTNTKAARKAMKRAKKEARRRVVLSTSPLYLGGASPRYFTSPAASPRYTLGGSSPRYAIGGASPRHGLGNNSPRYMFPPIEITLPRRRKHKVKHKKKHKDDKDRKHKETEVSSSTQDETKEQCINQKLSINLKRLNDTYMSQVHVPPTQEDSTTSSSDEHSNEQVPDFPTASSLSTNPPVLLRINTQKLTSAIGVDGVRLLVGDVVWGKYQDFPWWPGKINTITSSSTQQTPEAHVSWYGSTTSSIIQCNQLSHYLNNFKIYYNKKKKGPYKEAIRQATTDAKLNAENCIRQPLGNSPTSSSPSSHTNIIPQVVPPALASPREIDVMS